MKQLYLITWLWVLAIPAFAQTQAEMTQQACTDYLVANRALNTAYQILRQTCANDEMFSKRLKTAQRYWVDLRNADMDLLYPLTPASGSMQPQRRCLYATQITQKRTADLVQWNTDAHETYLCDGVKR